MDSFASILQAAIVSIPDMPCFAPTAPSQPLLLVVGLMRGNSIWTGGAGVGVRLGLPLGRKRAQAQRRTAGAWRCTCTWP